MPASRRVWVVVVALAAALLTVYLMVPSDAARAAVWLTAGAGTAVAMLLSARRNRPSERVAIWLLTASTSLIAAGQAVSLLGSPSPSYADIPRLLAYPTLAVAV